MTAATAHTTRPARTRPAAAGPATPVPPPSPPRLPADLEAGLRRLKLARIRAMAPELLATAKVQRWAPEEVLRTLIEAEIAAREASNAAGRLKAAAFPVHKTLDSFDVAVSSINQATFDYLAGLEWLRAKSNLAMIGPAGTGKSHTLIGLGVAAVVAGHKVRYFSPPPTWSRPSTDPWPTTPSARPSKTRSATTC